METGDLAIHKMRSRGDIEEVGVCVMTRGDGNCAVTPCIEAAPNGRRHPVRCGWSTTYHPIHVVANEVK